MKKGKIKALPFIQEFINYILLRAMRVLRLKLADFDHASIDVHPDRGTIWVWIHGKEEIIARAQFYFDGRCFSKVDNREEQGVTLKVK